MPLMDLTTPVELYAVEVLRDSTGRAQAYFTFMNCAAEPLRTLYATLTLLDDGGKSIGAFPLRCEGLDAAGHSRFTVCRAVDDAPAFSGARALVREAVFADGSCWRIDEGAVLDCTPPAVAPGPDRVALVAVAGPDAVCFPQLRGNVWVCVCGRFNRLEWTACRRCQRGRDDTLARYTPERTHEAYEKKLEQELASERAHRAARRSSIEAAESRARSERITRELKRQKRRRLVLALVLLLIVAVAALLVAMPYLYESAPVWPGISALSVQPTSIPTATPTPPPTQPDIPSPSPHPSDKTPEFAIILSTPTPSSDNISPPFPTSTPFLPSETAQPTMLPLKTGSAFG